MFGKLVASAGGYANMFKDAVKIGQKIGQKAGVQVFRVSDTGQRVFNKEIHYLASFKDGKPFKIVDLTFGEGFPTIFDASKNTITSIVNKKKAGFLSRIVKDAETGKVKGKMDLYFGGDGRIDMAALFTPKTGMETGKRIFDKNGDIMWCQGGGLYGPYDNVGYYLGEFQKAVT